jgi:hypothetical protein
MNVDREREKERPPVDLEGRNAGTRQSTEFPKRRTAAVPLLDLLGEISRLSELRSRGHISHAEFERRRLEVLERI